MTDEENKLRLEEKITRIFTEISALPKAEREKTPCGSVEFKALKTKLADSVWRWSKCVFSAERLANAGKEIMECVSRSILSYDGTADDYIKYISVAISAEIRRANERETAFESQSIHIPDKKRRVLKQMLCYAEDNGTDINSTETQQKIVEMFGCTAEEVADLVKGHSRSAVQSESVKKDDGEEISLLDTVLVAEKYGYENATKDIVAKSELQARFSEIDNVFKKQQERTKPYLSALITHRILAELESAKIGKEAITEALHGVSFMKTVEAERVVQSFFADGEFVTQEEIALWFGRDKTDASRAMKKILAKLGE